VLSIALALTLLAWAAPGRADDLPPSRAAVGEEASPTEADQASPENTLSATLIRQTRGTLVQAGGGLDAYFEHGVDIKGVRAPFTLHIGGLLQFDVIGYGDPSPALEAAAGEPWASDWKLRRGRFRLDGTLFRALHYRVRYNIDAKTGSSGFQDLYVDWSRLYDDWDGFWPRFRLGQVKEPLSLETLTSSKWISFLETATPAQAFAPGRNPGIRLQASPFQQRVTWWLGVFAPNAANLGEVDTGSGVATTARVTWLAVAPRRHPQRLLSLGAATSWRFNEETGRFRANAGANVGPNMIDTGTFAAHSSEIYQAEIVYVHDRFSTQAEVFYAHTSPKAKAPLDYYGFYAQATYALTGPGRNFNRYGAVFERVKVKRPVFAAADTGWGAVEVAARYSFTDLRSNSISGGSAHQFSLGLNWYMTQAVRVTLNYTVDFVEDAYGDPTADGEIHLLGIRLQFDF
jgi:phosphate-selective porin OprO/OprP